LPPMPFALSWVFKPLAVVSALAFTTLGLLSRKSRRARLYFHVTLYVGGLGLASLWGVVVTIVATAAGKRLNIDYYVARAFYHVCSPLIGITMTVEGNEHLTNLLTARGGKPQSAVIIANHQSMLDILLLGRIFPKRASIIAKRELKWTPLLGQFMALCGVVFVDRSNRKDAVRALQHIGDEMKKKGVSLWVFAEGTRSMSAEPALLPFKKGAFHLAVQAQVPIVPVVCENYYRLFDSRTRMDSGELRIKVLPPISTVGLTADDVTALSESTRELMLETLRAISVPSPSPPAAPPPAEETTPIEETTTGVEDGIPRRVVGEGRDDLEGKSADRHGEALRQVESRGESVSTEESRGESVSTEDEMDEDAVLLKRPRAV